MIGVDEEATAQAARECVGLCFGPDPESRDMKLNLSRKSDGGKYVSWNLELEVASQIERDKLFTTLADHPAIRIVI